MPDKNFTKMKKLIITILAALLIVPVFAQNANELFEKYNGEDGFTSVNISKELFSMMAQMDVETEDEDANDMVEALGKLDFIRILMLEKDESNNKDFGKFRDELNAFNLTGYTELMNIKENGDNVKIMVKKEGDIFSEWLLLIDQDDEVGFISISGDIDMETMSKFSKVMKMKGMDKFDNLKEYDEDHD